MALTALAVKNAKHGMHSDGLGLYLEVKPSGTKSWLFRYTFAGKRRALGLGATHLVDLAQARNAAATARLQVHQGIDPLAAKNAALEAAAPTVQAQTFEQVAATFIDLNKAGWRSAKHAQQWANTLRDYVYPTIGKKACADVTLQDVLDILQPIWVSKTETAARVRGRIEQVLGFATVTGLRTGVNPAAWKGNLEFILPAASKVQVVTHQPSMPHAEVKAFMQTIKAIDSNAARALEFLILTGARSGEVLGARWDEFDLDAKVWVIPAARMKAGKEHRSALSDAAVALVKLMEGQDSVYVFKGRYARTQQSSMTLTMLLRRLGCVYVAHGFRSSFRTWAAEVSDHSRDAAEMQLAHAVGNAVEQAYRRTTMFDKRLALANDWAVYLGKQ